MYVIDSSALIDAWQRYPIEKFPSVWEWLSSQIRSGCLVIPRVVQEEVRGKEPECGEWLKNINGFKPFQENEEIIRISIEIHNALGITDGQYGSGVNENDILIIATTKHLRATLITHEALQTNLPQNLKKCKMPCVCERINVAYEPYIHIYLTTKQGHF